jgi:hypothetical protein
MRELSPLAESSSVNLIARYGWVLRIVCKRPAQGTCHAVQDLSKEVAGRRCRYLRHIEARGDKRSADNARVFQNPNFILILLLPSFREDPRPRVTPSQRPFARFRTATAADGSLHLVADEAMRFLRQGSTSSGQATVAASSIISPHFRWDWRVEA